MEGFLIGAGLAFLVALLGWSEQIRSLRKDTIEAEKEFSKKRNIEWHHVRKIIRINGSASKKLLSLNKLLREKALSEIGDVEIIDGFCTLEEKRHELENLYKTKYILILILTFLFFISGLVNCCIGSCSKIKIFGLKFSTEFVPVFICVFFCIGILCFIINLYNIESKYREKFLDLLDKL